MQKHLALLPFLAGSHNVRLIILINVVQYNMLVTFL